MQNIGMSTTALFLDARTGRDAEARVTLETERLRVSTLDGTIVAEWPLDRLTMIEPGHNSARCVLGHIGNGVSRLTLFDRELRKVLIRRSPSLRAQISEVGWLRRFLEWLGWI
jgi:hypothetical protein